jgi:hypothetical protein
MAAYAPPQAGEVKQNALSLMKLNSSGSRLNRVMADRLDAVAIGVPEERGII